MSVERPWESSDDRADREKRDANDRSLLGCITFFYVFLAIVVMGVIVVILAALLGG